MKLRWRLAWSLTYPLARLLLHLRVLGRENLRTVRDRGIIIAANHTSNFDPLILGWAAAREIFFLAKEELFRYRPFAWLIQTWNAIPVRRGGMDLAALRRCSFLLRHRQTLVLFPEGTRSRNGQLGSFKPGVAMLAVRNAVPVIPCYIAGVDKSFISWCVDRDFVRQGLRTRPPKPVPITVRFAPPIMPEGFANNRTGYEQLTREILAQVQALAG